MQAYLNTAVTIYLLENEEIYCARSAVVKRFPERNELHTLVYNRVSSLMNPVVFPPEPIKDEQGAPILTQTNGRQWKGIQFKDALKPDNMERARHALMILRWLGFQTSVGHDDNGDMLYRSLEKMSLSVLSEVTAVLSGTGETEDPAILEIICSLNDLSAIGRDAFFSFFGTELPSVERKVPLEKSEKPKNSPPKPIELKIPKKWAVAALAAIFFAMVSLGPFSSSVAFAVLEDKGVGAAFSYFVRSGLIKSPAPQHQRTAALFLYHQGKYDEAISRARHLQAVKNISPKLEGDSYLIEGHSRRAQGDLYAAMAAYEEARETYHTLENKSYALGGFVRCLYHIDQKKALEEAEVLKEMLTNAGNVGDISSYIIVRARLSKDVSSVQEQLDYIEEFGHSYSEMWAKITSAYAMREVDPDYARILTLRGLSEAFRQKDEEAKMYSLLVLAGIEGDKGLLTEVKDYLAAKNNFELMKELKIIERSIQQKSEIVQSD